MIVVYRPKPVAMFEYRNEIRGCVRRKKKKGVLFLYIFISCLFGTFSIPFLLYFNLVSRISCYVSCMHRISMNYGAKAGQ